MMDHDFPRPNMQNLYYRYSICYKSSQIHILNDLRTEFGAHSRVKAPPPETNKPTGRETRESENFWLLERDLKENPALWPLPDYADLI